MKIHNDLEQGSEAWFETRKLKLTASHAQEIANAGKGLETYILELISEYLSSASKEHYSNEDTERGNNLESTARSIYEFEKKVEVNQVGFIEIDKNLGCSPDGLIGEKGLIEIKCPNDKIYTKMMLFREKAIDSKYLWQAQMQMLLTERDWCDLTFYNPNFKENMIVFRIEKDENKAKELNIGIKKGKELIKEYLSKLKK